MPPPLTAPGFDLALGLSPEGIVLQVTTAAGEQMALVLDAATGKRLAEELAGMAELLALRERLRAERN